MTPYEEGYSSPIPETGERPLGVEGTRGADEASVAAFNVRTVEFLNRRVSAFTKAFEDEEGYMPPAFLVRDVVRAPVPIQDYAKLVQGKGQSPRVGIPHIGQRGIRKIGLDVGLDPATFSGDAQRREMKQEHERRKELERAAAFHEYKGREGYEEWARREEARWNQGFYEDREKDERLDRLLYELGEDISAAPGEEGYIEDPDTHKLVMRLGRERRDALLQDMADFAVGAQQVLGPASELGVDISSIGPPIIDRILATDDPEYIAELLGLTGDEVVLMGSDPQGVFAAQGLSPTNITKIPMDILNFFAMAPRAVAATTVNIGRDWYRAAIHQDYSFHGHLELLGGIKQEYKGYYHKPEENIAAIGLTSVFAIFGGASLGLKTVRSGAGAVRTARAVKDFDAHLLTKATAVAVQARRDFFLRPDPGYFVLHNSIRNYHKNEMIRLIQKARHKGIRGATLPFTPARREREAISRREARDLEPDDAGVAAATMSPLDPGGAVPPLKVGSKEARQTQLALRREALLESDQAKVPINIQLDYMAKARGAQGVADRVLEEALKHPERYETAATREGARRGRTFKERAQERLHIPHPFTTSETRLGLATILQTAALGFKRTEEGLRRGLDDMEQASAILVSQADELAAHLGQKKGYFVASHKTKIAGIEAARKQLDERGIEEIQHLIYAAQQFSDQNTKMKLQIGYLDGDKIAALRAAQPMMAIQAIIRTDAEGKPLTEALIMEGDLKGVALTYDFDGYPSQIPGSTGDPTNSFVLVPRDPLDPTGAPFYFNPQRVHEELAREGRLHPAGEGEAFFDPDPSKMLTPVHEYRAQTMLYGDTRIDVPELLAEDYVRVARAQAILGEHQQVVKLFQSGDPLTSPTKVEGWQPVLMDTKRATDPEVQKQLRKMEEDQYVGADDVGLFEEPVTGNLYEALFPRSVGASQRGQVFWVDPAGILFGTRKSEKKIRGAFEHPVIPLSYRGIGFKGKLSAKDLLTLINGPIRDLAIYGRLGYATNIVPANALGLVAHGWAHPGNYERARQSKRLYGLEATYYLDAVAGQGRTTQYQFPKGMSEHELVTFISKPGRESARAWNWFADLHARRAMAYMELKIQGLDMDIKAHRDVFVEASKTGRHGPGASKPAGIVLTRGNLKGQDLTMGDISGIIVSASRRTKRAALDFDDLGPFAKTWVQHTFFIYNFLQAASKLTINSMLDYPLATLTAFTLNAATSEEVEESLGYPELPEWIKRKPYFPVGMGDSGPKVVNLESTLVYGVLADLGFAANDFLGLNKTGAAASLSEYFHPVLEGVFEGLSQPSYFSDESGAVSTGREIIEKVGEKIPLYNAVQRVQKMHDQRREREVDITRADRTNIDALVMDNRRMAERGIEQITSYPQALASFLIPGGPWYTREWNQEVAHAKFVFDGTEEEQENKIAALLDANIDYLETVVGHEAPPEVRTSAEFAVAISGALREYRKTLPRIDGVDPINSKQASVYRIKWAEDEDFISEEEEKELLARAEAAGPRKKENYSDVTMALHDKVGRESVNALTTEYSHVVRFRAQQDDPLDPGVMPNAISALGSYRLVPVEVLKSMGSAEDPLRDMYGRKMFDWTVQQKAAWPYGESALGGVVAIEEVDAWAALPAEVKKDKREAYRNFLDEHDVDVKVQGHTFASFSRMRFALRSELDRQSIVNGLLGDNYSTLSMFEKELLGFKATPGVQLEWRAFREMEKDLAAEVRSAIDKGLTMENKQKLANLLSPEFRRDYALSLALPYERFKKSSPYLVYHRKEWDGFTTADGSNLLELADIYLEKFEYLKELPAGTGGVTKARKALSDRWEAHVKEEVFPEMFRRAISSGGRSRPGAPGGVRPLLQAGGVEYIAGWFRRG